MRRQSWEKSKNTVKCFIALVTFSIIFNIHIWGIKNAPWGWAYNRCIYLLDIIFIFLFTKFERNKLSNEPYHADVLNICEYSLVINLIFILLTLTPLFDSTLSELLTYNGLVIALTLVIMLKGIKYEIFKS